MKCNKNNPCMGKYGKCLDVKITNVCNGKCSFCIERGGYSPEHKGVEKLIEATNLFDDYKKVLILGGEPFMYPDLLAYLKGIKETKDEIYITTNGTCFDKHDMKEVAKYLTAINISIHHYNPALNNSVFGIEVDFNNTKKNIEILKENGVKVRINVNLVKDYIDCYRKAVEMATFAKELGADDIRFAELQNCPDEFVPAKEVFNLKEDNPYCNGCEQQIDLVQGINTTIRLTCGIVNPLKAMPEVESDRINIPNWTKILYPNGTTTRTWERATIDDRPTIGHNPWSLSIDSSSREDRPVLQFESTITAQEPSNISPPRVSLSCHGSTVRGCH